MSSNKIYLKLVNISHEELNDFLDHLKDKYKVTIDVHKDTYSISKQTTEIYKEVIAKKIQLWNEGKLLLVYHSEKIN